jgi:hypothetical protein
MHAVLAAGWQHAGWQRGMQPAPGARPRRGRWDGRGGAAVVLRPHLHGPGSRRGRVGEMHMHHDILNLVSRPLVL